MDHASSVRVAPGQALYHAWLAPHDTTWPLYHAVSRILAARTAAEILTARRAALALAVETWGPHVGPDGQALPLETSDWGLALNAVAAAALEMLRLQGLCAHHTASLEDTLERLKAAEEAANTDALTGLPNRRSFLDHAERQLAVALRYGAPFTLLLLDVDHFKACNDVYGHAAGDVVLKHVARTLEAEIRQSDLAARYGGEEFTVLCPNTDALQALPLAERLREAIQDTLLLPEAPNQELPQGITISLGIATLQPQDSEIAHVLARADQALYAAKRGGRNQVVIASSDSDAPA